VLAWPLAARMFDVIGESNAAFLRPLRGAGPPSHAESMPAALRRNGDGSFRPRDLSFARAVRAVLSAIRLGHTCYQAVTSELGGVSEAEIRELRQAVGALAPDIEGINRQVPQPAVRGSGVV
jgi:hypothetical protein